MWLNVEVLYLFDKDNHEFVKYHVEYPLLFIEETTVFKNLKT